MRVLFVNENIGGHATVHWHLERALRDVEDVDAEFLHLPTPGLLRRVARAGIPGLARHDLDLQALRSQLSASAVARRAITARVEDFDVLHVYTQNAALLSVSIMRRVPTVVSTDSTNDLNAYRMPQRPATRWTPRHLPLSRWFERRALDAATFVVANSGYVAGSLRSTYDVPEERLRILPMGIPVPPRPTAADPASRPGIAFVGRQLGAKGGLRLLALHQARFADRVDLHLVTPDPVPPGPGVHAHHDIEVGDPALERILASCSVFAFPSPIDQSPNAVLEAMAAGLPVVALNVGALGEMVRDGVTGYVVEPDDDAGLERAVATLVDDPALARRMGEAGRRHVLEHYDLGTNARALVDLLHEAQLRGPGGVDRRP